MLNVDGPRAVVYKTKMKLFVSLESFALESFVSDVNRDNLNSSCQIPSIFKPVDDERLLESAYLIHLHLTCNGENVREAGGGIIYHLKQKSKKLPSKLMYSLMYNFRETYQIFRLR